MLIHYFLFSHSLNSISTILYYSTISVLELYLFITSEIHLLFPTLKISTVILKKINHTEQDF